VKKEAKQTMLQQELWALTSHHAEHCVPYKNLLNALQCKIRPEAAIGELPFLPVRMFKHHELRSIPLSAVQKTLTSSGTTGQLVSKIYLDKDTAIYQSKTLTNIMKDFIGAKRLPMILIDSQSIIKNRQSFSARGAGLLGLMIFGRDHFYLLDENMQVRWQELEAFLAKHQAGPLLLFGFTFMVWQFLYQECVKHNMKLNLPNSILIHSGGWKKLLDMAVSNEVFKEKLGEQLGLQRIYNFYGMVEQVGSVFMECEQGHLHTPNFADVIVRDELSLEPCAIGQPGIMQVLSILPHSYPGHSLLTEDRGMLLGEDDCSCGRKGKYFRVEGRIPAAELRGCSDTYAYDQR
jgi:phenylacetate-coenzyme A ligase PaaK-like adenylate-forming protein